MKFIDFSWTKSNLKTTERGGGYSTRKKKKKKHIEEQHKEKKRVSKEMGVLFYPPLCDSEKLWILYLL